MSLPQRLLRTAMSRKRSAVRRPHPAGLLVLPSLLLLLVFVILPGAATGFLSLFRWNLISPHPRFVGLGNYLYLVRSGQFWHSIARTLYFVGGTTLLGVPLSLAIALLLHSSFPGRGVYRTLLFIPYVVPAVATAMMWSWLLEPHYGMVNWLLAFLHLPALPWLSSGRTALTVLVLIDVWQFLGYFTLLFLGGLQMISPAVYEAGRMDGADPWLRLTRITLPLLSPTTFFVTTMSVILSFQSFDSIYVLTRGGPADSTMTILYYLFQQGFGFFRIGVASAVGVVMLAILFALTYLQFKVGQRWVYDQTS